VWLQLLTPGLEAVGNRGWYVEPGQVRVIGFTGHREALAVSPRTACSRSWSSNAQYWVMRRPVTVSCGIPEGVKTVSSTNTSVPGRDWPCRRGHHGSGVERIEPGSVRDGRRLPIVSISRLRGDHRHHAAARESEIRAARSTAGPDSSVKLMGKARRAWHSVESFGDDLRELWERDDLAVLDQRAVCQ